MKKMCVYICCEQILNGKIGKTMTYQIFFFYIIVRFISVFFLHYILQWEQHKEELREQKKNNIMGNNVSMLLFFFQPLPISLNHLCYFFSQSIYWPTYDLGFCTFTATYKQIIQIIQKEKQFSTITYLKLCSCCLPRIFHLSPFPLTSPTSVGFQLKTAHN